MTSMDNVLQLVNRLQSACTLLGDTAGGKDSDLPTLWNMLPSIVVIGGQVTMPELTVHLTEGEMRDEVCSGFSTSYAEGLRRAAHAIAWMPQSPRHGGCAAESATGMHLSGHKTDAAEVCCKALRPGVPQATPFLASVEAWLAPSQPHPACVFSGHCVSVASCLQVGRAPSAPGSAISCVVHVYC